MQSTYAIISEGGKQHRVKVGQHCFFETIVGDVGQTVELGSVLLLADGDNIKVGAPLLDKMKVMGKIVEHGRGDKIIIFKMRRRKGYRRTQGHRQNYTKVEITDIKTA